MPALPSPPVGRKRIAWALGLLLVMVAASAWWWLRGSAPAGAAAAPAAAPASAASGAIASAALLRPGYVDNQLCLGRHQEAGKAWRRMHHFMAMAPPTEATVRGDFANTSFRHQDVTSRFFRLLKRVFSCDIT
jgi:hypothetical protein